MPIRDLFCILEVTEKQPKAALGQSLALARGYGATVSVLVAGPKATAPYSLFGGAAVGDLVQSENTKIRARTEALLAEAKAELARAGAKGAVDFSMDAFHEMLTRAKNEALCNDLTVVDRPGGALEHSEVLFEEMLFSSGRPVLVPVPDAAPAGKLQKIVVAWDGSAYAARSLSVALALFDVKEADIAIVHGEKDLSDMVPAAKIAAHVERHGAKAKVTELKVEKDVGSTIDGHAAKSGADLIVMGAFGRSRLREFVLGGVTRKLSQVSSKPLLFSH